MFAKAGEGLRGFLGRWVGFTCARAAWVITASAILTLGTGVYVAGNLSINTDTSDMLSPELPFRRDSIVLSAAFPQFSDNLLVVLEGPNPDLVEDAGDLLAARLQARPERFGPVFDAAGHPFFRRNGLLYLNRKELSDLTERLAAAQPFLGKLHRDPSLTVLFDLLGRAVEMLGGEDAAETLGLARTLAAIAGVVEAQAAGNPDRLSWRHLMGGETAGSVNRRLIVLRPALDYGALQPGAAAIAEIRALGRTLRLEDDFGVRLRLTGSVALAHEELQSVVDGLGLAGLLSVALVLGLLSWGLGAPRLVAATLLTLIAGLVWTAGFAVLAVEALNLISVAFAVLFIGLSVDFGIHFCLRYKEEVARGVPTNDALPIAAEGIGNALTLSAVAAAIGFFSFLPTDYVGLAELGLIAGTGMVIALFASLTLLPALIAVLPLKAGGGEAGRGRARFAGFAVRRRLPIVTAALLAGVAAAALLPQARFDFDPLNLKDRKTESVATLFDIMEDSRTGPYNITILAPDLARADGLAARLTRVALVDSTRTLTSFVPKDQDAKLELIENAGFFLGPALTGAPTGKRTGDPARAFRALSRILAKAGKTARDHATAGAARRLARALARLEVTPAVLAELERRLLSTLPGRLAQLRRSLEAERVDLKVLPPGIREREVAGDGRARIKVYPKEDIRNRAALKRFVAAVRLAAPRATGSPVVILEAGETVVRAFLQAAGLSVGLIALLLIPIFRRGREIGLIFAPLFLAGLLTVAASVLLRLPFNFANVIVLPLLFGLGVAGAVHLVARERDGADVAATSTPRAVAFSALTTIGSFGSIALSSHPGTSSMGALLTIALVLTLLCTLVVLPALMALGRAEAGGGERGWE